MNKFYSKYLCAFALVAFLAFNILNAQDIHYSQFGNSPLNVSPALTGAFDGDTRFGSNYRAQWLNVPVGYTQVTAFTDMKFVRKKLEDKPLTPWAGGLMFDYDRAGNSRMNLLQLGVSGSYTLGLSQRSGLIIGGMLSGIQRAFDTAILRFGDQYNGKDPITGTEESFANLSKVYASLDAGLTYRFKAINKRTALNIGVGAFHLNSPKRNFFDEATNKLPRRYSLFALTTLQLTDNLDLTLNGNYQIQGPHTETVLSAGLPIHLTTGRTNEFAIQPGLKWRLDDAIIPFLLLHYNQWQFGVSYDVNTSAFDAATDNRGGLELSLIHIFTRPREAPFCPLCPTYL